MARGVGKSKEFDRVKDLPRRQVSDAEIAQLVELITSEYRTATGTMTLRPLQALALAELHDHEGLFGSLPVGSGKTLITLLAPTILEAKRPLLLLPSKLKGKTIREAKELQKHWQIQDIPIMAYELLSRERGLKELDEYQPDLIILDECHRAKNLKAACTKRLRRYINVNNTITVAVSGTITRRSLMDYWHILGWCLGDSMPLPRTWPQVNDWANALDEAVEPWARIAPGVLTSFCNDEELHEIGKNPKKPLSPVRKAFRRRLCDTPGVVSIDKSFEGSSIFIKGTIHKNKKEINEAFETLRLKWETPDGHPFSEAVDMWRHARELACGFYYRWNPRPPDDWLNARRNWCSFVRKVLGSARKNIDSELQVANACKNGHLDDEYFLAWREIRDTFKVKTEAVWINEDVLNTAAKWLEKNKGILWVEHVAFGVKLAEITGLPYFGAGGVSKSGQAIEDASGPIIASISANGEGRNLQQWNDNFIVSCPPSGSCWEQLMGRTHREGQKADEVTFQVLLGCYENWSGFMKSKNDALYVKDTMGQDQKILYADVDMPSIEEVKALQKNGKNYVWKP